MHRNICLVYTYSLADSQVAVILRCGENLLQNFTLARPVYRVASPFFPADSVGIKGAGYARLVRRHPYVTTSNHSRFVFLFEER